jgi:serine/threonine protein kinase
MDPAVADAHISDYKNRIKHSIKPGEKVTIHHPIVSDVYLCAMPGAAKSVCAVKISRIKGVTNNHVLEGVYLEASVIGNNKLAHPNIIRGLGAFYGTSEVLLCMEYLKGGDLLKYLCASESGMHDSQLRWFARQLCSAVALIHNSGYVHCDIKAENILIEDAARMNIKLADFGFLTRIEDGQVKTSKGSIHYGAPEIFAKDSINTVESDAWAVGVVIYAAARKELPYDGKSTCEVAYKIRKEGPKGVYTEGRHWSKFFPSLESKSLIRAFLLKDPKLRMKVTRAELDPWIRDAKPYEPFRTQAKVPAVTGPQEEQVTTSPDRGDHLVSQ